jgi:peroxiredoxin
MFEVLSDSGNQVAQTYKVALTLPESLRWVYSETFKLDLPAFNGDDSWTLPMPSRFIVDQQAVIRAADVNLDHTVRPEPDTAIEVLRILKS